MNEEKKLLRANDIMQYLGVGKSTAHKILKNPKSTYTVRIGSTYFANKQLLDKYIDQHSGLGKGVF